jgi:hypothetical protein
MKTAFVNGKPPQSNFEPFNHLAAQWPLDDGVPVAATASDTTVASSTSSSDPVQGLRMAWIQKKQEIFAGKLTKPDAEDPNIVNHLNWYEATGFTRPYPGEDKVLPPSEFQVSTAARDADDD